MYGVGLVQHSGGPGEAASAGLRRFRAVAERMDGAARASSCGGYLPPHRASLVGKSAEVRYASGIDKGMVPMLG